MARPTDYYIMYTLDGEVKEEISTIKPSIILDVAKARERDAVHLDIFSCDLVEETETVKSQYRFTMDELSTMDKHYFKKLVTGLLSRGEMEDLKSWF